MIARPLQIAAATLFAACSVGSPTTFNITGASVDAGHACPVGASNAAYDLHGTISVQNGTSKDVTISSVDATLTLAAVKGGWLQKVGDKYDAGIVAFTPADIGAGSSATLTVTVPSSCTGRTAGSPAASGDYVVGFNVITSAGNFKVDSANKHRITTA